MCYETKCGGETVATEAILKELRKLPNLRVLSYSQFPLTHTDFIRFFFWIIYSIIHWIRIIYSHRRVDWVYATTFTAGVAAALVKSFGSYHIIWHFHGIRIPPLPKNYWGKTFLTQSVKHWAVNFLHEFFLNRTDMVFIPTSQSKQHLLRRMPYLRPSIVRIVPNGVDLGRFHPISLKNRKALRKRYGIDETMRTLLVVGRIEKQKGLETLFEVMQFLSLSESRVRLFFVFLHLINDAEKKYKQYLDRRIDSYHIKKMIEWVEEPKHIEDYYHAADMTVSFSQLEFFPLTMLESIACKTLYMGYFAGNVGSFLSLIDKRLIIVNLYPDAIMTQLQSVFSLTPKELRKIQQKGYDVVKHYTWSQTARIIEKSITDFANEPPHI